MRGLTPFELVLTLLLLSALLAPLIAASSSGLIALPRGRDRALALAHLTARPQPFLAADLASASSVSLQQPDGNGCYLRLHLTLPPERGTTATYSLTPDGLARSQSNPPALTLLAWNISSFRVCPDPPGGALRFELTARTPIPPPSTFFVIPLPPDT